MIDLSSRRRVHIVGAGGAGMSAIAQVLKTMGHEVTGSDLKRSAVLDRLERSGLRMAVGHDAGNIAGADVVLVSTAIPRTNPEVEAARARGVAVLSRADMLAAISALRRTIAVAGTHGKTTTSSMLALILVEAGLRPSFIIGGDINDIGTNAAWEDSEWLVVEADESDGTFLRIGPEVAVVTSLDPDHIEHYGSFDALSGAFASFVSGAPSVVLNADDEQVAALAGPRATTYGRREGAALRMSEITSGRSEVHFRLGWNGADLGTFDLAVPGVHNAANAAAAIASALLVGASAEDARRALQRFAGVARRFEFRGSKNGVTFVDDYAHLPAEVRAALAAARAGAFERIVAVFQPHRYSRISGLAASFTDAFADADVLLVTDVYGAGEAARPGVSGQLIVDAVRAGHPDADAEYVPGHEDLLARLRELLAPGDCCISLEAGDLTTLPDELLGDERW